MRSDSVVSLKALLYQLALPVHKLKLLTIKKVASYLDSKNSVYIDIYLEWLSELKFEYQLVEGLCILEFMNEPKIEKSQIKKYIKKPSILAEYIISDVYNESSELTWKNQHSNNPKTNFKVPHSFDFESKNYLAPIYSNTFKRLEDSTELQFIKQWAWEYECIKPLLDEYKSVPDYYFDDNRGDAVTGSYHLRLADVLYSAYLRTLAFAVSHWKMPIDVAEVISKNCLPIDFKLAKVNPVEKPECFIKAEKYVNQDDLENFDFKSYIKCLGFEKNEILLAATFPLVRSDLVSADIRIRSCFMKSRISDIKQVINYTDNELPEQFMFHEWVKCNSFWEFMEEWQFVDNFMPMAFHILPRCFPRYLNEQILSSGIFLPSPILLGERYEARYLDEEIQFIVNKKVIGRVIFWYDNWKTYHFKGLNTGIGSALLIDSRILDGFLKNKLMQPHMAAQINLSSKKSTYNDIKEKTICSDLIRIETL